MFITKLILIIFIVSIKHSEKRIINMENFELNSKIPEIFHLCRPFHLYQHLVQQFLITTNTIRDPVINVLC